jgi:Domain of unknown function (DUF4394)
MTMSKLTRWVIGVGVLVALIVPLGATADSGGDSRGSDRRVIFATDSAGNLLQFSSRSPRFVRSKAITGLPSGVALSGIDFRPATGDLYALGSDKVVYRVNVATAIAVAEGPAFETAPAALVSGNIGFDFNPTVDKIRVTSDADDNIRLNPDEGNLLSKDTSLTPADVMVVGSAYTNSSFTAFATRPTVTELYALDIAPRKDRLWIQRPANSGTLITPVSLGFNLGLNAGFDIVGSDDVGNVGYVAGTQVGKSSAELWRVDLATGKTRSLGRIGKGVTITGLAAWQNQ